LKELNAQLPRLDDLGVTLVGVSADELDQPPKLKKRLELGFDLAADPDRVAINAFGVLDEENEIAWPALFVIDDGRILYRWIAKDKNKRKEAAEILDDIEEALR
jgi:peroxiredoxin